MRRAAFIGFLFVLSILAAGFAPLIGYANDISFARGQKLNHMLSVCLDKADAVAILEADEKSGYEAAQLVWMAKERCATLPIQDAIVGKVVKSAKVKRGDRTVTARVVEISNGQEVIGYFFTTATVNERNS